MGHITLGSIMKILATTLFFAAAARGATTSYGTFTYAPNPSPTYAKSNPSPTGEPSLYALKYSDVSHLLGGLSTTTWGTWDGETTNEATDSDDPFGSYAWTQLWLDAGIENYTNTALFSTTVEPTAIPSESLVLPPPDIFLFDDSLKFPSDFVFGVAGSAAQIEGAIGQEGRTPSVQELLIQDTRPRNYIANENYYYYKQDIARLAAIGVKYYSFSISWNRILPFAVPGSPVNQQGIDHYNDVIDTCLEYGIVPVVTLHHFDSPYVFNEGKDVSDDYALYNYAGYVGSYLNYTFEESFINYGKIVLSHYADRVPLWVSFNEPLLYSGYPTAVKVVVKATAALHDFYHNDLKGKGKFGIKFNDNFGIPKDPSNETDVAAAERFNNFQLGIYGNPLFLGKQVPDGWADSFPDFDDLEYTDDELAEVGGKVDFFGIDPYTITIVTAPDGGIEACQRNSSHPSFPECATQSQTREDGWKIGYRSNSYVYITPTQFREYLNYLYLTFHHPIVIGEFGFPEWKEAEKELGDQLYDTSRSIYYRTYLDQIVKAINEDGVDVIAAFAWCFADNWEFGSYDQQFGIQKVNRTTQERYYKKSFFDILQFVDERSC